MSAVVVPETSPGSPIRWGVVAWRLAGSAAVLVVALVFSVVPVAFHSWNSWGARLECDEVPGWTPRVSRGGWAEPSMCYYRDPVGRTMDATPSPTLGPPNMLEPRLSFAATVGVLALVWALAIVALWVIWHTGRARRGPLDAGRMLVA
jgi:hypothetical protein